MLILDSACPIAWRQPAQPSSSTASGSPSSSSKHHRSQSSLSNFDSSVDNSLFTQPSGSTDRSLQWLIRRYNETLYFGEEHSPLEGFLQHLRRFEEQRMVEYESNLVDVADKIRLLLKTRKVIRKRFSATLSSMIDSDMNVDNRMRELSDSLSTKSDGEVDVIAVEIICKAIESGPGMLVGNELKKGKVSTGKMTKIWLQAIECREIQIQILLVLYLLQLSTRLPTVSITSTRVRQESANESRIAENEEKRNQRLPLQSISTNTTEITTPPATAKRKRKAETARRWTGSTKGMTAFPWTLQRQSSREGQNSEMEEEEEDCSSPEVLSKRFESLLDSLCLQMLTCNLNLDDKKNSTPPSAEKEQYRIKERLQPWQLFGSEGRKRHQGNQEKDVLQWLCCSIIEPYFSKTLPRQCGIVRGKCFIPGSGTTPARPTKKEDGVKKVSKSSSHSSEQRRSRHLDVNKDKNDTSRRSTSRGKSPSPMPWTLLKDVDDKRTSRQSTPSILDKYDARTVTIRKSWSRSQSTGPIAMSQTMPSVGDGRSANSDRGKGSTSSSFHRPTEVKREPQTLVMATPSKNQSIRSSSFSQSQARHPFSIPSARSNTMASWRRTESQPVLSGLAKSELESEDEEEEEEEDFAADEQVVDSLFYDEDESDEEESQSGNLESKQPFITNNDSCSTLDLKRCEYSDDEREDTEAIVIKKRRTLPSNFSFTLGNQDSSVLVKNTSKNPFAVKTIA